MEDVAGKLQVMVKFEQAMTREEFDNMKNMTTEEGREFRSNIEEVLSDIIDGTITVEHIRVLEAVPKE